MFQVKRDMQRWDVPLARVLVRLFDALPEPLVAEPPLIKPKEEAPAMLIYAQPIPDFMVAPVFEADLHTETLGPLLPLRHTEVPSVLRKRPLPFSPLVC